MWNTIQRISWSILNGMLLGLVVESLPLDHNRFLTYFLEYTAVICMHKPCSRATSWMSHHMEKKLWFCPVEIPGREVGQNLAVVLYMKSPVWSEHLLQITSYSPADCKLFSNHWWKNGNNMLFCIVWNHFFMYNQLFLLSEVVFTWRKQHLNKFKTFKFLFVYNHYNHKLPKYEENDWKTSVWTD